MPREIDGKKVRSELLRLHKLIDTSFMEMAKLLFLVYHSELFADWGFTSFHVYCRNELSLFSYRKAMYFVDIWTKVINLKLDKKVVRRVGWTKMSMIVRIMDANNAKTLLKKAEEKSSRELLEMVRIRERVNVDTVEYEVSRTVRRGLPARVFAALYEHISEFRSLEIEEQKEIAEGVSTGIKYGGA